MERKQVVLIIGLFILFSAFEDVIDNAFPNKTARIVFAIVLIVLSTKNIKKDIMKKFQA